ncbi:putative 2-dehydro-3-deoxygalactonokinase [Roseobacter sp. SK209-2-6]|nr:putative 2-dehydro-3-deoxygalactonokinase [Roseobacter sp. SK209-2-6]
MHSSSPAPDWTNTRWIAAAVLDQEMFLWVMSEDKLSSKEVLPATSEPRQALTHALREAGLASLPILACGFPAAPSAAIPAKPLELAPTLEKLANRDLALLPVLDQATPPAQLAGSLCHVAGFQTLNPRWDGVICLPGSRSHWVLSSASEVVSVQSFITGTLQQEFSHRVLGQQIRPQTAWSQSALCEAVEDIMSKPERLAARLAELEVSAIRDKTDPLEAQGRLWGYLIGAELAAARPYWLGQNLALIAHDDLAAPYEAAFAAQGLPVTRCAPEAMALAGLTAIRRNLRKEDDQN